jgi:lipoprotein-anchoring transpeptidase ErfK/SrfK
MIAKSHPSRIAGMMAAALALVVVAGTSSAEARDRYGNYPAVEVAPDLQREWTLQLSPGSGVVPGYARPRLQRTEPVDARTPMRQSGIRYGARERVRPVPAAPAVAPGIRVFDGSMSTVSGYPASRQATRAAAPTRALKRADEIDPMYLPQTVDYATTQKPGTIVIDTQAKFLYRIEGDGKAKRYGVGVGKPGFEWAGTHTVSQKKEWPTWTPPAQMRERERAKGKILPVRMDGGPQNPLGARAMYLGNSLYRIHGTNQPWSIGKAVSSGCIRMRNEDVVDLYESVPVGTRVIVL